MKSPFEIIYFVTNLMKYVFQKMYSLAHFEQLNRLIIQKLKKDLNKQNKTKQKIAFTADRLLASNIIRRFLSFPHSTTKFHL